MKLRIQNGRILDPASGRDEVSDVWIDDRNILAVGRRPAGFKPTRTIDASNKWVCPGFIDLGARLREPGFEHKGTIESEARAAAAGGFTTVCCMPDTEPVIDTPAVVELINQRARGVRGARVVCIGALTQNLENKVLAEMGALKSIGCVAVSNAGQAITDTAVMANALSYAATLGLTVVLEAEDHWLARGGVMHEGAASSRLGLAGIPEAAETIGLARDLALVERTGVKAHFRTLSAAPSLNLIREAQRRGSAVSCDVGIMHLHYDDSAVKNFDATLHVRPPFRSSRDRQALIKAVERSQINAISAHHQPHDTDAKAMPFEASEPGISSFDVVVPLLLDLIERKQLSPLRAIESLTTAPASILGLTGSTVERGSVADLTIIDPDYDWLVSPETVLSAGKNTPLMGMQVRGKAVTTLVEGRIVATTGA